LIPAIESGALANPALDHRNLNARQRVILLRHAIIRIVRRDELEQFASFRFSNDDRRITALAAFHQKRKGVETIFALRLPRAVAGNALLLKNRRNLVLEADRGFCRHCYRNQHQHPAPCQSASQEPSVRVHAWHSGRPPGSVKA
jgi:hypothetical protein